MAGHKIQNAPSSSDVVIIGAGPAGMMAAIAARSAFPVSGDISVTLIDRLARPGLKLLASGGGRCNLTTTLQGEDFMARLGRQGRFVSHATDMMGPAALREFFAALGVQTVAEGERVYPTSGGAAGVHDALLRQCRSLGVRMLTSTQVRSIVVDPTSAGPDPTAHVAGVDIDYGRLDAKTVILAAGGAGYPSLGGGSGGFDLAQQTGHEVIQPLPALVGLIAAERPFASCAGVSLPHARVWIEEKRQPKAGIVGDVLFTHNGLSGPAVLDISGQVAQLLQRQPSVRVCINVNPADDAAAWMARFDEWQHSSGARLVANMLAAYLPRAAAAGACRLAAVQEDTICAHLAGPQRMALAALLTAWRFEITGTEGFEKAMVTRGGVSLKQVDPRTMRSRLVEGLYFAGEVLDLDGPSGGFNLQIAFSTGYLAGASAAVALSGPKP